VAVQVLDEAARLDGLAAEDAERRRDDANAYG
jgi:hypothetical protein